jgi:hypothetical protein
MNYPFVKDVDLVGSYPALVNSGGGYVWDEVLEYRVWCHPHDGAPNTDDGNDYFMCLIPTKRLISIRKIIPGQKTLWR